MAPLLAIATRSRSAEGVGGGWPRCVPGQRKVLWIIRLRPQRRALVGVA
jgi:hypothetical protein